MNAERERFDPAVALGTLALTLQLTVSGNLLVLAGVPYTLQGGSLVTKLHPASYIAGLAVLVRIAGYVRCRQNLFGIAARQCEFIVFMLLIAFCLIYAACMTGTGGLVILLDTFLPAGMVAFALSAASARQLMALRKLLCALFLINAVIALGEAMCDATLISVPSFADDGSPPEPGRAPEFRPTALYDHPLTGAAATMLALILYRQQPGPRRSGVRRAVFYVHKTILFIALLAFGGRMALLLYIAGVVGLYLHETVCRAVRRRLSWQDLLPLLLATALCAPLVALTIGKGMASRLQAHLYWDVSAQSRVDVLRLFSLLAPEQLIFGCRREGWQALVEKLRIDYGVAGIENCWILMFVTLGLLCFPVFLVGVGALLRGLYRAGDRHARLMVVTLLLVVSTSNSLGRKSILLTLLVGCVAASGRGWRLTHCQVAGARAAGIEMASV